MDDMDQSQTMEACPIDLSTKKFDQTVLGQQRSRLFESLANLASPQNVRVFEILQQKIRP